MSPDGDPDSESQHKALIESHLAVMGMKQEQGPTGHGENISDLKNAIRS